MKKFIQTCYKCEAKVKAATVNKEGVRLRCLRCPKCGEEYFTSSELIKYDILKGKRSLVRKFGQLGDSVIMRVAQKILKDLGVKPGDYGVFEERKDGIFIKTYSAKEIRI